MHNVGDIIELNGNTYQITYVSGDNYSYAPYKRPAAEPEQKPEDHREVRRRGRTRK